MIYRTSRELPANLKGYVLWLEVYCSGVWMQVCGLRPNDARAALRWVDVHSLDRRNRVRVAGQKV